MYVCSFLHVCKRSSNGSLLLYIIYMYMNIKGITPCIGTVSCCGVLGNLSCDDEADGTCYTASYAVQPDDSVTFIVSARTPNNTWVALGVSDDQFMVSAAA